MPLVRWQFRGLQQDQRKGFLFENVTNARGEKLSGSVAVSIYAGSPEIYAIGMGCEVKDIRKRWQAAQAAPLKPVVVDYGTVQDEVHMGDNLLEHGGLEEFPIPNSTPGFDVGPYTTASNWVTKDPEIGWMNVGNYRGQVKGPTKMGVFIGPRKHAWKHWDMMRQRGEKYVEAALVIGGPPVLTYLSGSRTPYGVEEYAVAGALIGEPLELVKCKTVDLHVPAHAELVIEGRISTEYLEPEAPFGEFTGYMGERVYNAVFETTAITHRKNPIFTCDHQPDAAERKQHAEEDGAGQQLPVFPAQPLRPARRGRHQLPRDRARKLGGGAAQALQSVDGLADALCHRRPQRILRQIHHRGGRGHRHQRHGIGDLGDELSLAAGPRHQDSRQPRHRARSFRPAAAGRIRNMTQQANFGSMMLIDATRKWKYPPVSLPAKPYMERAREIWEQLQLPKLTPRVPWHGYELGDWSDRDREEAEWAVKGEYHKTGERAAKERKPAGK